MPAEVWWLVSLTFFYLGVQACLSRSSQHDLDEAAMLPFVDDPEVEREAGCGTCDGHCARMQTREF
ncbi:hypothetical protein D3C77_734500 [compost metagenome]